MSEAAASASAAGAAGSGDRGSPFAPTLVIGAVVVGFVAFLAWAGLGAFEADFRNGDNGGAHALSKSAVGYSGLTVLLNAMGRPAVIAKGPVTHPGVMMLTIDGGDPTTNLSDLSTTRGFAGPIVTVLPKWSTAPMLLHRGWVNGNGLRDVDADTWIGAGDPAARRRAGSGARTKTPDADEAKAKAIEAGRPRISLTRRDARAAHTLTVVQPDGMPALGPLIQISTGQIDHFQTFRANPGYAPFIVDETGGVVVAVTEANGRRFYAVAEPDLFNNLGLKDIGNARAGLFVLNAIRAEDPVYIDVTLNGFERARSILKLMLQPPFLGATLCALAAAMLMIWHAIWRFGAPARTGRELALGKTVLADNQAGLIRMARREHRMGAGYVAVVRSIAARAVAAPRELAAGALDAFLDRMGRGRTQEQLSDIAAAAERAANNTELMDAAKRLHRWRLEMTRETR